VDDDDVLICPLEPLDLPQTAHNPPLQLRGGILLWPYHFIFTRIISFTFENRGPFLQFHPLAMLVPALVRLLYPYLRGCVEVLGSLGGLSVKTATGFAGSSFPGGTFVLYVINCI
jgi:hypothetical protein